MNLILRLKNKTTFTAIVGAVFLFIKQITEAFGIDLSTQLEQISGLVGAVITLLVTLGVVIDPTTKGVKDSGITKTYTKPRDENVNPVEYQKDTNTLMPEEYDTSQPFTDDTDEVEFNVANYEDDETLMRGQSKYHDDEVLKVSDEDGR
ncbi:phage holin [Staphylococcus xylosus]|uniref:phage holin n=1 Tax=Staphylococcus xylosus TaxID=1288 RepID=UPI003F95CDCD